MKSISGLFLALFIAWSPSARAADQPLPYTEGTVWNVTLVKVKPGFSVDYLRGLAGTTKKIYDEAKKQKLVLSYKILSSEAATPGDWDIMLLVEYKNMAALDGLHEKMRAIVLPMLGGEDQARQLQTKRLEIREILGEKVARELIFK
jgi:hypothetical protein